MEVSRSHLVHERRAAFDIYFLGITSQSHETLTVKSERESHSLASALLPRPVSILRKDISPGCRGASDHST